jgi:NAD(P)-dependent dehydrogenase (short-subunit alcohol dehydrogenase family)
MARLVEDRVVIVTGAGRGLGREYALMLADHGAKVVVNDFGGARDGTGGDAGPADEVAAEIRAAGGQAVANGADVSDWGQSKGMIDQAISEFGRLDGLISNAGILRDRMLVNMTEEEWDSVIRVHLKGTFAPARHAAAWWREQVKAGEKIDARIINTSSVSGIYGNIGQSNYGAAKMGIAGFTIIAARELRRYGITCNAIAPGAFTRLTSDLREYTEEQKEASSPKWVAPIATWLCSAESADVTGRVFESSGQMLAIAEGWHRGPSIGRVEDPTTLGPIVADMMSKARKNAGMNGQDLD